MTEEFAQPSTSQGIDLQKLMGSLLVVEVVSVEDHVPTVHTPVGEKSPAVKANVFVIDGTYKGEEAFGALIFPKVLQSQLSSNVGKKVLGRLGRGVAKPGKSAAWELAPATPDDIAAAQAWSAARRTNTFASAPATSTPPF
jgi:hypothetical protein